MPLTDTAVRNAKPKDKPYKKADERGLYLLVKPAGKYWRFDYRFTGKRKTLALGVYPDVSLADAREHRDQARKLLAAGNDPAMVKRVQKIEDKNTLEVVAREWFAIKSVKWADSNARVIIARLEKNVFPWLGDQSINTVTAQDVLTVLKRIEARGAIETAHRVKQYLSQIFRYAIASQVATQDPTAALFEALTPTTKKHYASIKDPKAVGGLLRALDGYAGSFITCCALRLAPLVFVRPGEPRQAEWKEFDLDNAEWRIPAERMKMSAPHLVPLSRQALAILQELHPLTGYGRYLFPSARSTVRPMSDNTINAALRRMGFAKDEMTGHGFRSMASTLLNEQGWHRDAIERQLAHAERDSVRAAYNYAEHLPERREMMQAWADFLDSLRQGADVVPIRSRR